MYTYIVKNEFGRIKIGYTSNLKERFCALENQGGFKLIEKYFVETNDFKKLEKELHGIFDERRYIGEWFFTSLYDVLKEISVLGYDVKVFSESNKKIKKDDIIKNLNLMSENDLKELSFFINKKIKNINKKNTTETSLDNYIVEIPGKEISAVELYEKVKALGFEGTQTKLGLGMNELKIRKRRVKRNGKKITVYFNIDAI